MQGLEELGRALDCFFAFDKLVEHDGRLHSFERPPGVDGRLGQRNHGFSALPGNVVQKNHKGLAHDHVAGLEGQHRLLGWLMQHHSDKAALLFFIWGRQAFTAKKAPFRLTELTVSHSSGVISSTLADGKIPALLHKTSTPP